MRRSSRRPVIGHSDTYYFGMVPEEHLWRIDWRKYGRSGVYVIAPEANWPCKIGVSHNPVDRLATLQTSHWKMLVVTDFWHVATKAEAMAIERRAHDRLIDDGKMLLGEWFDLKPEGAAAAVARAADELNITLGREFMSETDRREMIKFIRQRGEVIRAAKEGWEFDYQTGRRINL